MDLRNIYRGIVEDTYKNFTYNIREKLIFEILFKLLIVVLFLPLNSKILSIFMGKIGVYSITNKEFLKFALTPIGVVYVVTTVIIVYIAIFIESGILTFIANKSHNHERVSIVEAIINLINIFPRTISVYVVELVILSGVIGPLLGIGLYSSIIGNLSIPSFIKLELSKTIYGKIGYILFFIFIAILLMRWILSIPIIIIEDVKLKESFKNSIKIYKKSKLKILNKIFIWTIINFIVRLVVLFIFIIIGSFMILIIGKYTSIAKIATVILICLFFVVYIMLSIIMLPLFISFLVELYYKYRCYEFKERINISVSRYKRGKLYLKFTKYKTVIFSIIFIVFWAVSIFMTMDLITARVINKQVNITAHRGSSNAPENSISSIVQAIEEGADYAEIDIKLTKDEEIVLFHDSTLKRISGSNKKIADMTLEEIKRVDNGSYFSPLYSNERIPTLEEIFLVAKDKINLNIEIKSDDIESDVLENKLVELIYEYGMENQVVISSLNYESIERIKENAPLLKVGYILSFAIGDLTKLDVDFISIEYSLLKQELVYAMHALNKEVHVWTINDEESAIYSFKLGVDNIITDSVGLVENEHNKYLSEDRSDYLNWFIESINYIVKYISI